MDEIVTLVIVQNKVYAPERKTKVIAIRTPLKILLCIKDLLKAQIEPHLLIRVCKFMHAWQNLVS